MVDFQALFMSTASSDYAGKWRINILSEFEDDIEECYRLNFEMVHSSIG